MQVNDFILKESEKIILALRGLYSEKGFAPYHMSKFEEYDLYAKNKDFLVSDNVITFTDTSGKLMALKPDVTLSIIKNMDENTGDVQKVFYDENVYRISKGTGNFKEIRQAGVELFGAVDDNAICDVLSLAAQSLKLMADNGVLVISDLDVIKSMISENVLDIDVLLSAIGEKNYHTVDAVCSAESAEKIKKLLSAHGKITDVLPMLLSLCKEMPENAALKTFAGIIEKLSSIESADMMLVDFSVINDVNYYNGIVFKGFIKGVPDAAISGGQYDNLMRKMKRAQKAIGFAVYTDALEQAVNTGDDEFDNSFINVALPKGRLGEKVYDMFEKAGFECPSIKEPNRKLIFENREKGVRYFWVKPSDVAIYVERGAADIGVAGKDILLEYEPEVYELCDLDIGKCRMAVAGPENFKDDTSKTLRVATKFSNIARNYYQLRGRDIDIIHLNGSIEIAPILGLSHVIVDIVETGTTLKENDLCVLETVAPISARLIANKSSFQFKSKRIKQVTDAFGKLLGDKND